MTHTIIIVGTFDNELRQIKDESIKRMKVYLEATQNSIDILIPYKCDNPKHDRFTCDYCQNKAGSWRQSKRIYLIYK